MIISMHMVQYIDNNTLHNTRIISMHMVQYCISTTTPCHNQGVLFHPPGAVHSVYCIWHFLLSAAGSGRRIPGDLSFCLICNLMQFKLIQIWPWGGGGRGRGQHLYSLVLVVYCSISQLLVSITVFLGPCSTVLRLYSLSLIALLQ